MSVVYIAGPMTCLVDKGRSLFRDAAARLRADGHIVLDPSCLPDNMPGSRYMPICLAMLEQADELYLIGGAETLKHSKGATIEYEYAYYQGKNIRFGEEIVSWPTKK